MKSANSDELFNDFSSWVDRILLEHADVSVAAYNFNLYEHEDEFAIQLIGAKRFDRNDDDWPCHEEFTSGEDLFALPKSIVSSDYRKALKHAKALVAQYLEIGKQAPCLKASQAVGIGFVSGDLYLLYSRSLV